MDKFQQTHLYLMKLQLDEFNRKVDELFPKQQASKKQHTKEDLDAAYQRLLAKKQKS